MRRVLFVAAALSAAPAAAQIPPGMPAAPKPGQPATPLPASPSQALKEPEQINGKSLAEWMKLATDRDPSNRELALRNILLFGPFAQQKASQLLVDAMKDTRDFGPRINAVMVVAACGLDSARARDGIVVLGMLAKHPAAPMRLQAINALATFGPDARGFLTDLMGGFGVRDETSWEVRRAAAFALGRIAVNDQGSPDPMALKRLCIAINDPALPVRDEAIKALLNLGPPATPGDLAEVKKALADRTVAEKNLPLWVWTKVTQMRMDRTAINEASLNGIAKLMKNDDQAVRVAAAQALGIIGVEARGKLPELVEQFKSDDALLAATAMWAVLQMGPAAEKALPAYREIASHHKDEHLRKGAEGAIEMLTPKKK